MDTSPSRTAEDYVRALRRSWYIVVAGAVLFGLAGFLYAQRSTSTAVQGEVVLSIVDESGVAASAGVTTALLDTLPPGEHALAMMAQLDELLPDRPDDVVLVVRVDPDGRSVVISPHGPDSPETAAVAEDLAEAYRERRTNEARDRFTKAGKIQLAKAGQLAAQVTELDETLSSSAGTAERESLMTQRIQLVGALISAQQQALALEGIAGITTGGIGVSRVREPVEASSSSSAALAVVGAIVGAMLAAVAVLALAVFDRRLRSRNDVERIVDAPVLGVVPSPTSPQQIESYVAIAGALVHAVGDRRPARVQIVAVTDADASGALTAGLSEAMQALGHVVEVIEVSRSPSGSLGDAVAQATTHSAGEPSETALVHTTRPLAIGADGAALGSVVDTTILVVSAGDTTDRALASAASVLVGSGGRLLGIVLFGVPTRDLEWASAG